MSVVFPESVLSKRKRVVNKLVQGKEYATQLKLLLDQKKNNNPVGESSSDSSVKELVTNVLRSFADTLSVILMMTSSESDVAAASGSNDMMSSEDSSESSKKRFLPPTKDQRGSYKRRKTDETQTIVSQTTDVDGQAWRKYGQKEILNSQFPRCYFRCSRKHDQGCRATKQVQQIQENPDMYKITYIGFHTCKVGVEIPHMFTHFDTNWALKSQPDEHNPPAKEEYSNEESDLTDNLDPSLWSELKDFELSKPAAINKIIFDNIAADTHVYSFTESQNLELDFGVFSSDFDFQFDQSHLI